MCVLYVIIDDAEIPDATSSKPNSNTLKILKDSTLLCKKLIDGR
jgi:hypothetical protein